MRAFSLEGSSLERHGVVHLSVVSLECCSVENNVFRIEGLFTMSRKREEKERERRGREKRQRERGKNQMRRERQRRERERRER